MPDMSADIAPARDIKAAAKPVTLSVIIPTFRRAEGLKRAANSILAQTGTDGLAIRLIVCDNSPQGCAKAAFDTLPVRRDMPAVYIHEPRAGVANARNAAVAASDGDFIAFLDDDEEAPIDWLSRMVAAQARFGADVVFGPVQARLGGDVVRYRDYFSGFFSRFGPVESGLLPNYYGCGNSLLKASWLAGPSPFSATQNEMGGEDDVLFHALKQRGAVMAWAADAPVWEDVPPQRATLDYTLRRGFAYGQGPSHSTGMNGRWLACAGWMAQGVVQALVFGGLSLIALVTRSPSFAFRLDKAARGMGKLLWFPPFKMKFYGQALLKKALLKKDKT